MRFVSFYRMPPDRHRAVVRMDSANFADSRASKPLQFALCSTAESYLYQLYHTLEFCAYSANTLLIFAEIIDAIINKAVVVNEGITRFIQEYKF